MTLRQVQDVLHLNSRGQGLLEFTAQVEALVIESGIQTGQVTVFCCHTSCSLLIQENADPDVQVDLMTFFRRMVPEGADWMIHTLEGPDDMPAHIKSALTQTSITIPVAGGQMMLGTWQGIFLFEHRRRPHQRQIAVHVVGE